MAYVDQSHGKERTFAFIITAIIIIGVGYAFITGLAYQVTKKLAKDLNVIDIQDKPPPPPEEPPPPPKEQPKVEVPPIVAPPPLVRPPVVQAPILRTVPTAPPVVRAPPAPTIAPPAPPKPSQAVGAKPRGNPGEWVTNDDYPPSALRAEAQGRTSFKLDIDGGGKVTNCTVTSSSGNSDLDATACRLLPRRARFSPAKDAAGNGLPSSYSSSISWQIPKD